MLFLLLKHNSSVAQLTGHLLAEHSYLLLICVCIACVCVGLLCLPILCKANVAYTQYFDTC